MCITLLQHGADVNIRNTEGKTALEVADVSTKPVLTGEYRKDELLEAARSGNEERLLQLLNPLNVNCHASDGRRSTPLHLAAGYNRSRVVQILLQNGADVHAKDKGLVYSNIQFTKLIRNKVKEVISCLILFIVFALFFLFAMALIQTVNLYRNCIKIH